jgi:hypothetical protein
MNLNNTTKRVAIRRAIFLQSFLLGAFLLSACAHVQGYTTLSDGKILKATGTKPDVNMDWKCLKEDAVVQLTGNQLPANAPKTDCYMTILVTAKSSDISDAVGAYLARSGALQSQATTIASLANTVATSAGSRAVVAADAAASAIPSVPGNTRTASVVNSVAATAAMAPDSSTIQAAATSLGPLLSPATKEDVQQQLESLSVQTPDLALANRLHEAADQIGQAQ